VHLVGDYTVGYPSALLNTTIGFCDKQLYGELFISSAEFILSVQHSRCVCHWYGTVPDLMLQLLVTILAHTVTWHQVPVQHTVVTSDKTHYKLT